MLVVKTLPVGDLTANCYLVSDGDECLIIDPGDDADFITETIANEKLTPTAIVLTHGHFDHVLGCLELKLNFDVPILLHEKDKKIYTSANQSAAHWLKKKTLKVPPIDQFIKEADKIKVGAQTLTVIETPGHTPGSICLYHPLPPLKLRGGERSSGVIFTGDTLFANAVGRTDLSYSSPSDLAKSLKKIRSLPSEPFPLSKGEPKGVIVVYPGHGESFILSESSVATY
ncbi:MBL fold metallo-hydrolase [Candidatus Collierbacteria bacterium]|nr:MBL fold metallo-hydrolase [Candidatus Collierbacteria bacterium]